MPQRDARLFIEEARDACAAVIEFSQGRTFDDFLADRMFRDAVERNLAVIGEALNQAMKFDPRVADTIPEIRRIIDFRNILIHAYFSLDRPAVWSIVTNSAPELLPKLIALLERA
jgi:uncharacterized protein with HEPN domain